MKDVKNSKIKTFKKTANPDVDILHSASRVAEAWNNAGRRPDYHRKAQLRLIEEWPTLAFAVAKLADLYKRK